MPKLCQANSCRAEIVFAEIVRQSDGKRKMMPFDAQPSENGSWFLNENHEPLTAEHIRKDDHRFNRLRAEKLLHQSHYATCADVVQFGGVRKKKGKSDADGV